ncbi:choline kinase family protein [Microbaculum marinum]|uniref:Choline kinase family protein n=1 Tax=Microbaculum marinum TaxID=1764581 RepID=A0AAW9RIZ2_9HYPH
MTDARTRAAALSFWSGPVDPLPLGGGITNVNFVVEDRGEKFVVRIGDDIPVHQVMRFNELAASRAAARAGISPEVLHSEPGALVIRYVDGKTFGEEDVRDQVNLERILPVVLKCHRDVPNHLRGPVLVFWVFHVLRDYAGTLRDANSAHADKLPGLLDTAGMLEEAVGQVDMVFGHNDLLPANFIDDGDRIWLIDWDYAGFNSPLFDLGGLASNNGLSPAQEEWLLEAYFDRTVTDELRRRYAAMKCASLMRETMWSMVSEIHSDLDFDYAAYTAENTQRLEAALAAFYEM